MICSLSLFAIVRQQEGKRGVGDVAGDDHELAQVVLERAREHRQKLFRLGNPQVADDDRRILQFDTHGGRLRNHFPREEALLPVHAFHVFTQQAAPVPLADLQPAVLADNVEDLAQKFAQLGVVANRVGHMRDRVATRGAVAPYRSTRRG